MLRDSLSIGFFPFPMPELLAIIHALISFPYTFPVVNLPPLPKRLRVFPFLLRFLGWNANIFRLSNDKLFWMKAFSCRTVCWIFVRETMFGTAFGLCNPILLVSKTSRGADNCCAGCFSFAPYADSISGYPWKTYNSASAPEILSWHFFRAISRFPYNFFLWHSILVDNNALLL